MRLKMIVPLTGVYNYISPSKNKTEELNPITGKPDSKFRSYYYCWMNEQNTIRQSLTGITCAGAIAHIAKLAVAASSIPFLTGTMGLQYIYTGHKWLIPQAIESKKLAKEKVESIRSKCSKGRNILRKDLSEKANDQQIILTQKLKIANLSLQSSKLYTLIGYGLLASAITSFITPGINAFLHYSPLIAGAAATYLVGAVTLGVGFVAIGRGIVIRKQAWESKELETQILANFEKIAKDIYQGVTESNFRKKKEQITLFLERICTLDEIEQNSSINREDSYTKQKIDTIKNPKQLKTY